MFSVQPPKLPLHKLLIGQAKLCEVGGREPHVSWNYCWLDFLRCKTLEVVLVMFAFCWVSLLAWKIGNPWSEVRRKIRFRDRELIGSLKVVIDELEKSKVIWIWVVSYIHSFQASTGFGLSTFTIAFQASSKSHLKACCISFSSRLNHGCQDVCVSIRADMRFTKPTSSIHWMHDCKQANCRVVICVWNASKSRKLKQSDWWRHERPTWKEELVQDSLSCWSFFESCPCLQLGPSWARLSQSSTVECNGMKRFGRAPPAFFSAINRRRQCRQCRADPPGKAQRVRKPKVSPYWAHLLHLWVRIIGIWHNIQAVNAESKTCAVCFSGPPHASWQVRRASHDGKLRPTKP